jgi:hypothetical protein
MKKSITFFTVCINIFYAQGHGVVGKWKTIDDQSVRKISGGDL